MEYFAIYLSVIATTILVRTNFCQHSEETIYFILSSQRENIEIFYVKAFKQSESNSLKCAYMCLDVEECTAFLLNDRQECVFGIAINSLESRPLSWPIYASVPFDEELFWKGKKQL